MSTMHVIPLILLVYALGAISPGPSFLMVTRAAIGVSRRSGIRTAVGISIGTMLSAGAGLWGLAALLANAAWLATLIRIAGGCYLVWLGISSWRGACSPLQGEPSLPNRNRRSDLRIGILTEVGNPKTLAFFASLFASVNVSLLSTTASLATVAAIGVISACWYSLTAIVISSGPAREFYRSSKKTIDRITGSALLFVGGKLILLPT